MAEKKISLRKHIQMLQGTVDSLREGSVRLARERNNLQDQLDKRNAEAAAKPFRRLHVILEDASGKSISTSIINLNNGDEASATVDAHGDICITTSNSQR